MKKDELLETIGELDERMLLDSETPGKTGRAYRTRQMGIKIAALLCAGCVGLILTAGLIHHNTGVPDASLSLPPASDPDTTQYPTLPLTVSPDPRITFLHATGDGSQQTELVENVRFPYRTKIRLRNISGVSDQDFLKIAEEEEAYLQQIFSQYPETALNCWARYRGEDVLITTLSAGSFCLRLEDPMQVEAVEISVTDMGHLMLTQRIDGRTHRADQKAVIHLDAECIQKAVELSEGNLSMFWHISSHAASMIKEDPDMELSSIQDTITVSVTYRDGTTETCTIDMLVQDDGEVYAVYQGQSKQV